MIELYDHTKIFIGDIIDYSSNDDIICTGKVIRFVFLVRYHYNATIDYTILFFRRAKRSYMFRFKILFMIRHKGYFW